MIASWRSGVGRDPTIASATLGPTPLTVSSSVKKPELLDRAEAVQRLLVLADEVERVQLEDLPPGWAEARTAGAAKTR